MGRVKARRPSWYILAFALVLLSAQMACGDLAMVPIEEEPAQIPDQAPTLEPLQPIEPLPSVPEGNGGASPVPGEAGPTGEPIQLGDVRWTILQTAELGQVLESSSETIPDLGAAGRLVGVRFKIENAGQEPLTFMGMTVVDGENNEYSYVGDALPFITDEEACEVEELQPGVAITCTAIYDVPEDATGLQGVLTDLNLLGGEQVPADLGLD